MTGAGAIGCFSTGAVRTKRAERGVRRYLPGAWRPDTLPVNVFVVDHPQGLCLFDAGQTVRAAEPGHFPPWWPFFRLARFEIGPGEEAADHLARMGFAGRLLRWIVLSHLHTDHVGGLGGFSAQQVLVSRREWERATGVRGRLRGYLPQYWPQGLVPRLVELDSEPLGPFPASSDLAGDGTLRVVAAPGHTPGHLALLAQVGGRRFLLGGDLAPTADRLAVSAPAIADFCRSSGFVPLLTHDPAACARAGATGPRAGGP